MSALRQGLRGSRQRASATAIRAGRRDLREQLAGYLARARGVRADPELVVVCAGFRHGLSLVARALRLEGCACDRNGGSLRGTASGGGGERELSAPPRCRLTAVEPAPICSTRAPQARVLSPAHQFPMGVVLHRDRRAAAITWATATGGLIVEDDYDGEFRYDCQPVGALQALGAGFRGLRRDGEQDASRQGCASRWIVVPPRLLDTVASLRSTEDVHVSALEQIALCEMLRSGGYERHVRRMRARYRARRDRVLDLLAQRAPALVAGRDLGRHRDAARVARGRSGFLASGRSGAAPLDRAVSARIQLRTRAAGRRTASCSATPLWRSTISRQAERARGGALGAVPGLTRAACNDR